ncbi:MAG: hypothetical protein KAJ63_05005 [Methyloprofundus sp.]|nr:hypothetical protein [Methyloprofundus sp.]
MQAYYEIETEIPLNHQLKLQLPDSIPSGHVKIAVIYELPKVPDNKSAKLTAFLESLPDTPDDKGLSREAINNNILRDRQGWD